MKKIHSRAKRKFKISRTLRHYYFFHQTVRKKRPKTFSTEERAREWASEHGIRDYDLKMVKKEKRFQIVGVGNGQD